MRFTNCSLYSAAIECYPGINPEKMLLYKTKSNILVLAFYSPLLTFYSVAALDSALGVGMGSKPAFRRCALVEHLLQQEMRRLYSIRKAEEEWVWCGERSEVPICWPGLLSRGLLSARDVAKKLLSLLLPTILRSCYFMWALKALRGGPGHILKDCGPWSSFKRLRTDGLLWFYWSKEKALTWPVKSGWIDKFMAMGLVF